MDPIVDRIARRRRSLAGVATMAVLLTGSAVAPVTGTMVSASASPRASAATHGTITVDGRERSYRLYVPADLPDGPVPLFIGLHGGTGWADQFAVTNHSEELADAGGFIVVHPDGVNQPGRRGGVWNGGVCCGFAAREDVDDVAFIDALLVQLGQEHDIDPLRVYAFGHSNGGIMSYRLACELADRIVGIGVVAGTLGITPCAPAQPVSVLHIHGTEDRNLPIAGGVGPESLAGVDFPPPRDGFAHLAEADGCTAPTESTDGDLTIERREPCDGGSAAVFVEIATAGHPWPGGTPAVTASGSGYAGYDATAQLVEFLLAHPRP